MALSTANKARLIQAVAVVEHVADELAQRANGGNVAAQLRQLIGALPTGDVSGDQGVKAAAAVVKAALAKATPAQVAAVIIKRIDRAQAVVKAGGLTDAQRDRAIQLLGQASALADRVLTETARDVKRPKDLRADAPAAMSPAVAPVEPAAPAARSWADRLAAQVKSNPVAAIGLGLGFWALLRRK